MPTWADAYDHEPQETEEQREARLIRARALAELLKEKEARQDEDGA